MPDLAKDILAAEADRGASVTALAIEGGTVVSGEADIEGSKISSITMIAAALLTDGLVVLRGVPDMLDHRVLCRILRALGADVQWDGDSLRICSAPVTAGTSLPDDLVGSVHGTMYLLPALLARHGHVRIPRSRGGCKIGVRPVKHIAHVLRALGARVKLGNVIEARVPRGGLVGTRLPLQDIYGWTNSKFISGATKTAILAGVAARGETVVEGAYWRRPISDLCGLLRAMGADIEGDGSRRIRIRGTPDLHEATFQLPCDRLVLGTCVAAAGMTQGVVRCSPVSLEGMDVEIAAFRRMGIDVRQAGQCVVATGPDQLRPIHLSTESVDTDLGPIFAGLMSLAEGHSSLEEVVWEKRFQFAPEFRRMGAVNTVCGRTLHVTGVPRLAGATVAGRDLRSAAALVLAGLAAEGRTTITGAHHLCRGYEDLPGRLAALGARIRINPQV